MGNYFCGSGQRLLVKTNIERIPEYVVVVKLVNFDGKVIIRGFKSFVLSKLNTSF